jgi:basic membrane protein A
MRLVMLVAGIWMFSAMGSTGRSEGAVPLKVALCVTGSVNDGGWSQSAYEGLRMAEKELGVKVAYTENVQVPDMEATFVDYASQGYDLIIGHGFQ